MQQNYNKKRKLNKLKASLLTLMMVLFAGTATAQRDVLAPVSMQDGVTMMDIGDNCKFYDSHGQSHTTDPTNNINYWDRWYKPNENFTYTFRANNSNAYIKVEFGLFEAYDWTNEGDYHAPGVQPYNCVSIGQWAMRINDDVLTVTDADGDTINTLTGNTKTAFAFIAKGAITFHFTSNENFNEEGWEATVTCVENFTPQPPFIQKANCDDHIVLYNTTPGSDIYYSTTDNDPDPFDPLSDATLYTSPVEWPAGSDMTVKAVSVVNNVQSAPARATFYNATTTGTNAHNTDRTPVITDSIPGLDRIANQNRMIITCPAVPSGLNETFVVVYTTNGDEPELNGGENHHKVYFVSTNHSVYNDGVNVLNGVSTYEFDWNTPNVTFKAKVFGVSCSNLESNMNTYEYGLVYVPDPTISFEDVTSGNNTTGTATISSTLEGQTVVIYYTLDGSEPTAASNHSNSPLEVTGITPGATVKAYAMVNGEGFQKSQTITKVYIPGGQGSSGGVYGSIVLLDDREEHEWSYYSDGDQPVHSLKPADVKITYFGNSQGDRKTMTTASESGNTPTSFSATASGVKVNHDADANQFIYLKTLEAANADGSGNYPYTMIPNPFQVRPKGTGGTVTPGTRTIYVSGRSRGDSGLIRVTYTDANGQTQTWSDNSGQDVNTTLTVKTNTTLTVFAQGRSYNYWGGGYNYSTITARYDDANGTQIASVTCGNNNYSNGTSANGTVNAQTISVPEWRGFYAWRIKSLSSGLTISGKSVGDIVYADEEISFVTNNAKGNEVEFEALWAQAYVNSSTYVSNGSTNDHPNYQNAYERNFKVGTTITTYNYPVTFSTLNPDGTGTLGTITIGNNGYSCSNDVKFENMTLSAANRTITAAGHDLIFGRGVSGTVNYVRGAGGNLSAPNYHIRLESGTFNYVSLLRGYSYGSANDDYTDDGSSHSGNVTIKSTIGNDYDRAVNETNGPDITQCMIYGYATTISSTGNRTRKTLDMVVKSGKIGSSHTIDNSTTADVHQSLYVSVAGAHTNVGERSLTIEGGEISNIAGGIDGLNQATNNTPSAWADNGVRSLTVRMKGGTVRGAFYGGAAKSPASGDRHMVFTGGTIKSWLGAGCNGTDDDGGQTYGKSYVYVGGNTHVGGGSTINGSEPGTVFGAGKGYAGGTGTSGEMSYGTKVVVADKAVIENDVYGGGNYGYALVNTDLYVLGGTVQGNAFGGSNRKQGVVVNVFVKGGTVVKNVYGGSNTTGTISGLATVNVSGGTVTNVFGGGLGSSTSMASGTKVTVSGGSIVPKEVENPTTGETEMVGGNVYGGGEEGTVTGNTNVTFSGGTVMNVYGAGKGVENATGASANIAGSTVVTVSGGTVSGSVYGGGENGTVAYAAGGATSNNTSKVTLSGGTVTGDVFGGGKMGTTQGNTHVTVSGGSVKNVFGGALGEHGKVYVAGTHTVNIIGQANVLGSVYGGSRNANDALSITGYSQTETNPSSMVNISGGNIKEHVYAAGYYGSTYGSVYASIGLNAVNNNPYKQVTPGLEYDKGSVTIGGSVWAGGDWGTFSGSFGGSTVSGNSNIYLDGYGYETTSTSTSAPNYMNIGLSVLGCGTSCDAGKADRILVVRHYGTDIANTGSDAGINPVKDVTRELKSIQRFKKVIFDNTHLGFEGQGKLNDLNQTEKYSLYAINEDLSGDDPAAVYVTNGTTLVMNAPGSQLKSFHSSQCNDVYAATPTFTTVYYNSYTGTGAKLSNVPNKIRVNGGSFIELKYDKEVTEGNTTVTKQYYGELEGYCYMMNTDDSNDATCAYARPKWGTGAPFNQGNTTYDNQADGGFVSYDWHYNTFDAGGNKVAASQTGTGVQIDYENHAPARSDTEYFRVWRYSGNHHTVDGILLAQKVTTSGAADYYTVDVTIELPAWQGNNGSYYRFDRVGDEGSYNYLVDWGTDVMTGNAAYYYRAADDSTAVNSYWMYFSDDIDEDPETETPGIDSGNPLNDEGVKPGKDFIDENPNVNFGLVAIPGQAITPLTGDKANGLIICDNADSYLAGIEKPFACADFNKNPQITFRLTYSNALSSNMSYDPILIPLVQCKADGTPTDYVTVRLTVNTSTTITSGFSTKVYARMNGGQNPNKKSFVTVQLPSYPVATSGEMSQFTVTSVDFTPGEWYGTGTGTVQYNNHGSNEFGYNAFGLTLEAYLTPDNIDDWRDKQPEVDGAPGNGTTLNKDIAKAGGRSDLALAVNLYYNEQNTVTGPKSLMGTVTFHVKLDNYGGNSSHVGEFDVTVEVYRIGESQNYFVDGINGEDNTEIGRGLYPDFAAKSVNYILNRLGFLPGDNIFVVNEVGINKAVNFNGEKFQSDINIWRYPGAHDLKTTVGIEGNEDNKAYTGVLFNMTKGSLTVNGTKIDGMYYESQLPDGQHHKKIYPVGCDFDGASEKPLISVGKGTTLNLTNSSQLLYNYNAGTPATNGEKADAVPGEGGAVKVANGGILKMNAGSVITGNICEQGGGVFMDGSMIVSDSVRVYDNMHSDASNARQDNIWLTKGTNTDYKVVQIGLAGNNNFTELYADDDVQAKLGIDKKVGGDAITDAYGFLPVVFAEDANLTYLDAPYANPQVLIVHDQNKYKLERGYDDNYLYWIDTWVTYQTHQPTASAEDGGVAWDGVDNITTPNQLAWLISLVNGENGQTAANYSGQQIVIKNDLDLSEHMWVPIGQGNNVFKGTFEGNGHVVEGLGSRLVKTDMGMFGKTEGANIQNVIVNVDFVASATNMGAVAGTMIGGTLSNVEGSGIVSGTNNSTRNVGGLVGQTTTVESGTKPTIKSAFAVNTLNGGSNATVGGLVGTNGADIYNSFSNVTLGSNNAATIIGGLVGVNGAGCTIENCYNATETANQFAATNNGTIQYCYGKTDTYCGGSAPVSSGTYDAVKGIKEIGYMYGDNFVNAENNYVADTITYANGRIDTWPGLLSTLNQWVKAKNAGYTTWLRPTTSAINDDLPVLVFSTSNSMASFEGNKFIKYSNDLDALLTECNAKTVTTETPNPDDPEGDPIITTTDVKSSIFLYGNATDVAEVPATMSSKDGETVMKVSVNINEDVVLKQTSDAEDFTATVGISFDNSDHGQHAYDYYGNQLTYDWHFMSTPLSNANIGATYESGTFTNSSHANISGMVNGYFPNGLSTTTPAPEGSVKWDFYTYYEPDYHWINLKRSGDNHWHQDNGNQIHYVSGQNGLGQDQNETIFVPGKGYMMAISQDSYMSSTGMLNNSDVTITLTNQEPLNDIYNKGWNLVGNPYQAYLDLKEVGAGTYYIYDAESGVYVPYAVSASENDVTPSRYIHPHQGFFMYSASDGAEFTFTPDMATTTKQDGSYFRGDEQINYPLVNLFARNQAGNRDLTVIEFNRPEIGGATKVSFMTNANFSIAAHLDNESYGLLFTPEGTEKVPVHFIATEDGTYTLDWSTYNGDFTSLLLFDNKTGAITDMLRNDSYTFEASKDDYASRFYITYTVTDVDEYSEGDGSFAFFDGSEWVVNGKGQLDIVDVTGRVLFSKRIANEQNRVNLDNVAKGVYLMRVIDGKNTMVQKIVVR